MNLLLRRVRLIWRYNFTVKGIQRNLRTLLLKALAIPWALIDFLATCGDIVHCYILHPIWWVLFGSRKQLDLLEGMDRK